MSSLVQLRIAGAPADLADGLRLLCRDPHIAQRFGDAGPFLDVWFEPMHQRAAGGGNGASAAGDGVPAAEIQIVPRGAPAASPGAPPSAASVSAAQGPALPPSSSSSSSSSAPAAVPGLAVPTASLGDASAGSVGSNGGGGMASSGTAVIRYARRIDAFRAIGVLLRPAAAALVMRHGGTLTWSAPFKRVGVMLDVSRNAVLTVDSLLWLLQRLALLGVNVMMLYTEDTYTIESQPFFGYMRGRYTHDELRAVDRAALALGIEVVPCIQVLGHMSQALQWPAFDVVRDQQDILLADNADTYRLIEHQLFSCESCFTSRRVHLGMDEAAGIGLGRYYRRNGPVQSPMDIFVRHAERAAQLARDRGWRPMMWSDMWFALAPGSQGYYDVSCAISDNVRRAVPDIDLVYWDYYHVASDFYSQMIARHRTLLHDPERFAAGGAGGSVEMSADTERERSYETFDMDGGAMGPAATVTGLDSLADDDDVGNDDANASDGGDAQGRPSRAQSTRSLGSSVDRQVIVATGAWTWNRFWPAFPFAFNAARACVEASMRDRVDEILTTVWGDDGAECDILSALPAIVQFAELCWRGSTFTDSDARDAFWVVSDGCDMHAFVHASKVDIPPSCSNPYWGNLSKIVLWDDPLLGMCAPFLGNADELHAHWERLSLELASVCEHVQPGSYGDRLRVPQMLAKFCSRKILLRRDLVAAYRSRNLQALRKILVADLEVMLNDLAVLHQLHRTQWLRSCKPFGLEVLEHRYGAQMTRLRSTHSRLGELLECASGGPVVRLAPEIKFDELEQDPVRFFPDRTPERLILTFSRCSTGCATYVTGESWR